MPRRIHIVPPAIVFAVISLAMTGCEDSKPTPPAANSAAAPTTSAPAASATAAASADTAPTAAASAATPTATAGKMSNCPSAVDGATTDIKDVDGGVELTVTAKSDSGVKDIRARSKMLADAAKTESTARKHNGTGEGGGAFGRCPAVMRDTNVTMADVDGGTKITVKAKAPGEVDWLRRESRERLAELSTPGAKDAGQGKMEHCPSAIDGTKTAVKKGAGAVIVTVTGQGDDKVKEIRERAKHLIEASKVESGNAAAGKHNGDGAGGGGFGRCPVVLKDTTVTAKDVAGGSEFTVKPAKAADLAALLKDSQERADKFNAPGAATGDDAAAKGAAAAPAKSIVPIKK